MHAGGVPAEAPALLWFIVVAALAAWWLWPWLALLSKKKDPPETTQSGSKATTLSTPASMAAEVSAVSAEEMSVLSEMAWNKAGDAARHVLDGPESGSITFDPASLFKETFSAVAAHVGEVLQGPPKGATYLNAVGALYFFSGVLDKIFQSWGTPEVSKVSRLRATSAKWQQALGRHPQADVLLRAAGFQHVRDSEADSPDDVWFLPLDCPESRLRALAAKLCLVKLEEQQKARGARRWIDECNDSVLPNAEEANLAETTLLYRAVEVPQMEAAFGGTPTPPSQREKNVEIGIRSKLNARRSEVGLTQIEKHEGLVNVARAVAHAERTRKRVADRGGTSYTALTPNELDVEVRKLLSPLLLPPGVSLAHLHFTSEELPRIFGLASTTGAHGKDDVQDEAAERIAVEAFEHWKVRQAVDVEWPSAVVCGVGTALDYTLDRGFVCMLLVGYEDAPPPASLTVPRKDVEKMIRQRPKPMPASGQPFGARVNTLDSSGFRAQPKRGG